MPEAGVAAGVRLTDVPPRLDRLPWARFHWRVVVALGITWMLDGLEVTLAGSLAGALHASPTMQLSESQIGLAGSAYLIGAVFGALFFGWLTDRYGRRRIFFVTLLLYMAASTATGFSWDFWSFAILRALTGAGIGGEYAAVNSAIQELVPARLRGTTDLAVNGTFWGGAALGSIAALTLLNPAVLGPELGWRAAFVVGGLLSLGVLLLRRNIPESPRWLVLHGREAEASRIVDGIEAEIRAERGSLPPLVYPPVPLRGDARPTLPALFSAILTTHRRRAVLCLILMAAQAFLYNAMGFTYALVLTRFHGVDPTDVGWHLLPFALCNLAGALLLGPLFDRIGRRPMITATYAIAGVLMAATALAFAADSFGAWGQTAAWGVIFFFASAAASAAYLTVGESFPLEMRAMAIALFYALGTGIGGVAGPTVFGFLIEAGGRPGIMWGYLTAAALMLAAAAAEWRLGFAAEGMPLEQAAAP